jgi:tripartite-type tricarboxylate transporter receptor subunit TctC
VASDGIFAPAGTPAGIINRLNQEIVRLISTAEIKEKIFSTGGETVGGSPEQFAAAIKSEIAKMAKLIKDAGIKAE